MLAADLFLAFRNYDDVDRELSPRGEVRLERLHVEKELAFVVHRSARENLSVAHSRLERRRCPELERLGRLDVVVAVDENGRRSGRIPPLTDYDRMTRS